MYGELASVRGVVDLSPQDALDEAQSFLEQQGYTLVRRTDNSVVVERRLSDQAAGQYTPNLTVATSPQPGGGVRITVRGNDREGVQANQAVWLEWSESLPRRPEAETSQTEQQESEVETTEVPLPPPSTSEEAAKTLPGDHPSGGSKRYCYSCGEHLPHEATNFCPSCGAAQVPRVEVPTGPPSRIPEAGRISTSYAPNVPPPPQSQYQQRGPGVWSGVKIFFGGCIVLPFLLFLFFVSCAVLFGSAGSGG